MDMFNFLLAYLAFVAFVLFILLFGESPLFVGTPVSFCHWLITIGPCIALEWTISKCCGAKGGKVLLCVEDVFCNRRNPFLQVMYLLIWSGCYYLYCRDVFTMLPGKYIGGYHTYTGSFAAFLCLVFFFLASITDPGTVTKDNCRALVKHFPFDDAIYKQEKDCSTCGIIKPARSKHCSACRRCVARFDHHCGWINNCVGLNNHIYFIGFLATNLIVAIYGTILIPLVLYGDIEELLWHPIIHPRRKEVVYLANNRGVLFEWLMIRHPVLMVLLFISLVVTLLMGGFLAFHLYSVAIGKTTNEGFKWADLYKEMQLSLQVEERGKDKNGSNGGGWFSWSKEKSKVKIVLPRNAYNLGVQRNFAEILFPRAILGWTASRNMKRK
ncbi:hypothetical protein BSKO_00618 [Bryopsis sp. KO-2023]|nr:hypothetical protein BSKO_00618 [Bryopsis sp. KO-2023]